MMSIQNVMGDADQSKKELEDIKARQKILEENTQKMLHL
jgi:uncharacterized protein YciU (UPF0263 family)